MSDEERQPRMPTGPAPRLLPNGERVNPPKPRDREPANLRPGMPGDGLLWPEGNERHIFEKREVPLCFMQPYYSPIVFGPEKVPKQPVRITNEIRAFRGAEVCAHGDRRIKDVRKLSNEFKDKIKEAAEREKRAEAEKNKQSARLRWWHTRQSVELRDLLKTMKFNNYTFKPELLLNAKDVVILNLTGCRLGDDQMHWVSTFMQQNGTLRRLILQANQITAEGVENLREGFRRNQSLIDIDLSLNPILDSGLNKLVSIFSENRRTLKVSKVNVSTCGLTASSGYHLARLIRDFKCIEVIYAWRNRIGMPTESSLDGVTEIFTALAQSKTLKHIDLSANCLSEADCADHATVMEQQARTSRLDQIHKHNRKARIEELAAQVAEMKSQELWEDEKVILQGKERELVIERQRYKQDLEEDVRQRRQKDRDFEWIERVRALTGRELADPKVKIRLVLAANHSVTPMTVSRLAQFYDLNSKDDTHDWINRVRRYDHMVKPRRAVGQEYTQRTWEEATAQGVDGVWDYEADMRRIEEEARAERAKELDELRRQGVIASDVLEQRLRGRTPARSVRSEGTHDSRTPLERTLGGGSVGGRTPLERTLGGSSVRGRTPLERPFGGSSVGRRTPREPVLTISVAEDGDAAASATPADGMLSPRTLNVPGTSSGVRRHASSRSRSRGRSRTRGDRVAARDDSSAFHSAVSEDLNPATEDEGGATTGLDDDDAMLAPEQSDAELFANASASATVRREVSQRRTGRRTRSNMSGGQNSKLQVGMSATRTTDNQSSARRRRGGGGDDNNASGGEYVLTVGGDDDDEGAVDSEAFGTFRQSMDGSTRLDASGLGASGRTGRRESVAAFDDDVFASAADDEGEEASPMAALMQQLAQAEVDSGAEMQRKLDQRMEEMRERLAAKAEQRPRYVAPVHIVAVDSDVEGSMSAAATPRDPPPPRSVEGSGVHQQASAAADAAASAQPSGTAAEPSADPSAEPSGAAAEVGAVASADVAAPPSQQQSPRTSPEAAALLEAVAQLRTVWANVQALAEVGSPTDDDIELLNMEKAKAVEVKRQIAAQLAAAGTVAIRTAEDGETVSALVEDLVRETDRAEGTTELVGAILAHVAMDWPTVVDQRALAASAAIDGSTELLGLLLAVPGVRFDVVEVVCSCFFNQSMRIPLAYQLLTAPQPVPLAEYADDLQDSWQEFFEDVAAQKRAIPREDRAARMDLLALMLRTENLTVNAEIEGPDGQTCFSRACLEGDAALVKLLFESGKVTDINMIRGDGMDAMQSAVIGNNAEVVKLLLASGEALTGAAPALDHVGPNGSALDLAVLLQRDPAIAAALKQAGAKPTAKSAKAAAKPKPKGKVSVSAAASKLTAARSAKKR